MYRVGNIEKKKKEVYMLNVSSFAAEQLYPHKAKKIFPNVKN